MCQPAIAPATDSGPQVRGQLAGGTRPVANQVALHVGVGRPDVPVGGLDANLVANFDEAAFGAGQAAIESRLKAIGMDEIKTGAPAANSGAEQLSKGAVR